MTSLNARILIVDDEPMLRRAMSDRMKFWDCTTEEAATGEEVTAEQLGGGEVHTTQSGVVDHLAESDEDAIRIANSIRHKRHRGEMKHMRCTFETVQ